MLEIKNCLGKFYKSLSSVEEDKKQISDIVKKHTQTSFPPEGIEIKNHIICVKTSPAILNKIFIYKNKILEEITQLDLNTKVVDIRGW